MYRAISALTLALFIFLSLVYPYRLATYIYALPAEGGYIKYRFRPIEFLVINNVSMTDAGVYSYIYKYIEEGMEYSFILTYTIVRISIDIIEVQSNLSIFDRDNRYITSRITDIKLYRRNYSIILGNGSLPYPNIVNPLSQIESIDLNRYFYRAGVVNISVEDMRVVNRFNYPYLDWIYRAITGQIIYKISLKLYGGGIRNLSIPAECIYDEEGAPYECRNIPLLEYLKDGFLIWGSLKILSTNMDLSPVSMFSLDGIIYLYNRTFMDLLEVNEFLAFLFYISPFLVILAILLILRRIFKLVKR